jgi:FkbM family methyltransferase
MTVKDQLLARLNRVEQLARATRWQRLLHHPYRYIYALCFRGFVYAKNKTEKIVDTRLFYGRQVQVALPAATDIYLTGGKSHVSEIRLARFLIHNLSEGDHFLDIGAHYGYFTLLAAELVGASGKVMAFEPTERSYQLLAYNTQSAGNIQSINKAVSNSEQPISFYEFPNRYSEYNASDVSQFEQEDWYKDAPPQKRTVAAKTIDMITAGTFKPQVIKIDVEGAEQYVIAGGLQYFRRNAPIIVMEYLAPGRSNDSHRKALELLTGIGYRSFVIASDGSLQPTADIDSYLLAEKLDSDNIVFSKRDQ